MDIANPSRLIVQCGQHPALPGAPFFPWNDHLRMWLQLETVEERRMMYEQHKCPKIFHLPKYVNANCQKTRRGCGMEGLGIGLGTLHGTLGGGIGAGEYGRHDRIRRQKWQLERTKEPRCCRPGWPMRSEKIIDFQGWRALRPCISLEPCNDKMLWRQERERVDPDSVCWSGPGILKLCEQVFASSPLGHGIR